MSISKEDVKKLADLARIEMTEAEMQELSKEMDSILGYVKIIQDFHPDEAKLKVDASEGLGVVNVMREDANPIEGGTNSKEIIAEFPNKKDDFLKVKKIL